MWKIIKGCYSVTRETVKLAGQGVEELAMGLNTLKSELESFNKEANSSRPFKRRKGELRLWKKIIEGPRALITSKHMYEILEMCEFSINEYEKIIQLGLDRPNTRLIILPLIKELEDTIILPLIKELEDTIKMTLAEYSEALKNAHGDELGKDLNTHFRFAEYLGYIPEEKLEEMAKEEYSKIKYIYIQLLASFEKIRTALS